MKINFSIHGFFNGKIIRKSFELKVKNTETLEKIIKRIGKKINENIYKIFIEKRGNPIILINGRRADFPEGFKMIPNDGDEITLLQALGGG